ncbi:putative Aminotransferase-like plant mobile domain-containing protein [Seiridium unicorne]|uniref:Aminotransferase-like plant mobile domain-containing protein n=1 Tax=Seiridium unicorne TaxID=138068 RepID=A0ABR2V805_9PEZI
MSSDEEYDPQGEEIPQEDEEMTDKEIEKDGVGGEMEDLDEEDKDEDEDEEEQEQDLVLRPRESRHGTPQHKRTGKFLEEPREPVVSEDGALVKEIRDAIAPIAQRAYDRRVKGAGHSMGSAEKISEIVDLCVELRPGMLTQLRATARALLAQSKKPRPPAVSRRITVQHILDRMPKPDDARFGLDPVEQVQIQQRMNSDPQWVNIRDADVSHTKHSAFWAAWRAICAAGACPTELISARNYLKFKGDDIVWVPGFCDHLKNLVLGSPCGKNYALLGCFIRLTVASRMDDHRAVPLSDHGQPDGSFFDVFAGEMSANTDGKSLKEVHASAREKWSSGGKDLPWESRVLTALERVDWRERAPAGRGLKGPVETSYEVTTHHLRRLMIVFDSSAKPDVLTAREYEPVVEKAKSVLSVNKKHRNPFDVDGIRRLRERSFLLDMYFAVHKKQPARVLVPEQGVQLPVEPEMDNSEQDLGQLEDHEKRPVEGDADQKDVIRSRQIMIAELSRAKTRGDLNGLVKKWHQQSAFENDDPFEDLGDGGLGTGFGGDDDSPPPTPQKRATEEAGQPDPKRRKAKLTVEQEMKMIMTAPAVSVERPVFLAESTVRPECSETHYDPKSLDSVRIRIKRVQNKGYILEEYEEAGPAELEAELAQMDCYHAADISYPSRRTT